MKWLVASVLALLFLGLIAYTHYLSVKPAGPSADPVAVDTRNSVSADGHARVFKRSSDCAQCHQEIYGEWLRDQHATAWTEEKFSRFTAKFTRIECLNCHAPEP